VRLIQSDEEKIDRREEEEDSERRSDTDAFEDSLAGRKTKETGKGIVAVSLEKIDEFKGDVHVFLRFEMMERKKGLKGVDDGFSIL